MSKYLINLVIDKNEIAKIYKTRSKSHEEKTVSGKTLDLAKEKAKIEEKEGWEIVPTNYKKSIKLRKEKTTDVSLEDDTWSLLVKMGFDEFSKDRNFKIYIDDKTPPRQIDVFAKDKETALFFECTCTELHKEKNLNELIEKILSIRNEVFSSTKNHYGHSVKLKMRFVIVTRNIVWRNADLIKAESNNIIVLRDEELEYYRKLAGHIKTAAKYQLLAQVFSQEKIDEMDIKLPSTRGRMGGQTFYNFLIRPSELLKIAYISHKQSRKADDFNTYQRMLKPHRLESIAHYIDHGGQFPTNIVINIRTNKGLKFEKREEIGESSFGTLYLPKQYACAWIIDGQHRLYGYAYSERMKKGDEDKTTFPVLAYENLPSLQEAELFVDINSKQERVQQNLIKEIYANLRWDSNDEKSKMDALLSRTVLRLNTLPSSPFYERFTIAGLDKTNIRCLTLTSFVDGLKDNRLLGDNTTIFKPGPLYASYEKNLDTTLDKACKILAHYFDQFKNTLPDHWALGNEQGGFLCTNNGIRSLLVVLKEILFHIKEDLKTDLDDLPAESIVEYIDEYIEPITQFFISAPLEMIQRFRKRQAKAGVNDNAVELMSFIHNKIKDFCPIKLHEYLESIDEVGTGEARELVDKIQIQMFNYVVNTLKETYGERWWYDGVPEKVRTECSQRHEAERGVKDREQYLCLIDYQSIARDMNNWPLFENAFTMSKDGGKEKKLKWVAELNTIRNITHHREKWPATKDQVKYVRQVHEHVMEKFKIK